MIKIQDKVEQNVKNGYGKSYKTLKAAKTQIEKAEKRLNVTIDAIYVALESGRIGVAIAVRNDPMGFMTILHGTTGWLVFN